MVRKANEDAMIALPEAGLFSVADGMGGVAGGAFASQNILEALTGSVHQFEPSAALDIRIACLREAVGKSNHAIRAWAESQGVSGTGTTLVLLTFDPSRPEFAALLHAGDSRAYLLREGKLQQLTRDHSAAESFGDGTEESVPALFRNVVTNAIGMSPEVQLDETLVSLRSGDYVLLCSDGLYRMVAEPELTALLAAPLPIEKRAASLIHAANQHGGKDNITAVIVHIGTSAQHTKHGTADSDTHDTDMRSALEMSRQIKKEQTFEVRSLTDEVPVQVSAAPLPVVAASTTSRKRFPWTMLAAFVLLTSVAASFYIGRTTREEPVAKKPVMEPEPAASPVPAIELPEPVSDVMARGFATGDWSFSPDRLAELTEEEDADTLASARAWMDEWRKAKTGYPQIINDHETERANIETIVRVWNPAFTATVAAPWPDDASSAATAYCLAQSRLHGEFFSELDTYVSTAALAIGAFGKKPSDGETLLRAASSSRVNEPPVINGQVQTLRNLVRSLNRWKERSRHLPVGEFELRNVTTTFLEPVESGLRDLFVSAATYAAAIPAPENVNEARPEVRAFYVKRDAFVSAVENHAHMSGPAREQLAVMLREVLTSAGLKDVADVRRAGVTR